MTNQSSLVLGELISGGAECTASNSDTLLARLGHYPDSRPGPRKRFFIIP